MFITNSESDLEYSEGGTIYGNLDEHHNEQIPQIYAELLGQANAFQRENGIEFQRFERTVSIMKDIRVNYESCEYNADNSTLTTKGTLEYGGQQFNAEFVQHQDETPTVHVRNEDVEFTCHNGVTAEVHNYNSMDYDADAIFKLSLIHI